jgi:hypothetical protein
MKRSLWVQHLTAESCPAWPCPICRSGHTRILPKSLIHHETVESRRAHAFDEWGPEQIEFKFTAWAKCSRDTCGQMFSIAGIGGVDQVWDDVREEADWIEVFSPQYISPAPELFSFPVRCPSTLRDVMREAFRLYWSDVEACAGRLRTSLEAVLTHVGVPEVVDPTEPGAKRLTLHTRIEQFSKDNPSISPHLMALKWLGNSGSHGREISRADVLDAFELFEFAMVEILDKPTEKMLKLAAKLTEKHSPRK